MDTDVMKQYTFFVELVKEYSREYHSLSEGMHRAMEECIEADVLRDILLAQKKEGQNMVLTEFDQEKYDEMIKDIGREEGREEGRVETYCRFVAQKRISLQEALQECGVSEEEFLKKMENLGLKLEE